MTFIWQVRPYFAPNIKTVFFFICQMIYEFEEKFPDINRNTFWARDTFNSRAWYDTAGSLDVWEEKRKIEKTISFCLLNNDMCNMWLGICWLRQIDAVHRRRKQFHQHDRSHNSLICFSRNYNSNSSTYSIRKASLLCNLASIIQYISFKMLSWYYISCYQSFTSILYITYMRKEPFLLQFSSNLSQTDGD